MTMIHTRDLDPFTFDHDPPPVGEPVHDGTPDLRIPLSPELTRDLPYEAMRRLTFGKRLKLGYLKRAGGWGVL
jgi:hypothetical protein